MKLNKFATMLVSEIIGKREIDQNAQTALEIAAETGYSRKRINELMTTAVRDGKIERVFKRNLEGRLCPAYRQPRKK